MIDVDYNEYKKTIEENMNLITENHKLKEEIERLNNIMTELEIELYTKYHEYKDSECEELYAKAQEDKEILDYIKELKERKK